MKRSGADGNAGPKAPISKGVAVRGPLPAVLISVVFHGALFAGLSLRMPDLLRANASQGLATNAATTIEFVVLPSPPPAPEPAAAATPAGGAAPAIDLDRAEWVAPTARLAASNRQSAPAPGQVAARAQASSPVADGPSVAVADEPEVDSTSAAPPADEGSSEAPSTPQPPAAPEAQSEEPPLAASQAVATDAHDSAPTRDADVTLASLSPARVGDVPGHGGVGAGRAVGTGNSHGEGSGPREHPASDPKAPWIIPSDEAKGLLIKDTYALPMRLARGIYTVEARICVDTAGVVDTVRMLRTPSRDLGLAVFRLMRGWRFRPRLVHGAPAPFCYVTELQYRYEI